MGSHSYIIIFMMTLPWCLLKLKTGSNWWRRMTLLMLMIMICFLIQHQTSQTFYWIFFFCFVCLFSFCFVKVFPHRQFYYVNRWMYRRILWFGIWHTIFQLKIIMINIISFLHFIWHMGTSHRMMFLTKIIINTQQYRIKYQKRIIKDFEKWRKTCATQI